ncbi:MAG: TIGR04438 family Trp-rich protein [Ideonella sp.]|nr:TIGR04438 family Trp-rich protein [Ideonella sp.]
MWMVAIGCVLSLLKLAEFGPVARWDWWLVLSPFAVAAIWWYIADTTGYTQRKAMERDAKRTEDRRMHQLKALGLETFDKKFKGRRPPG